MLIRPTRRFTGLGNSSLVRAGIRELRYTSARLRASQPSILKSWPHRILHLRGRIGFHHTHEHEYDRRTPARRVHPRSAFRHNASRNRQLHLAAPRRSLRRRAPHSLARQLRRTESPSTASRLTANRRDEAAHVRRRRRRRAAPRRSLRPAHRRHAPRTSERKRSRRAESSAPLRRARPGHGCPRALS